MKRCILKNLKSTLNYINNMRTQLKLISKISQSDKFLPMSCTTNVIDFFVDAIDFFLKNNLFFTDEKCKCRGMV